MTDRGTLNGDPEIQKKHVAQCYAVLTESIKDQSLPHNQAAALLRLPNRHLHCKSKSRRNTKNPQRTVNISLGSQIQTCYKKDNSDIQTKPVTNQVSQKGVLMHCPNDLC